VLSKVIFIFCSVFLLSSCSFQDPEVTSFDGIDVLKMEENSAEVDINITLNNPNSQALKLKKAEFDILINSIYFGKAKLLESVVLPKNGDHAVKLHMAMELDKTVAEMAVAVGIAALMNNINLKVRGEASGSMGLFGKSFEVDHSEKIDWNELQDMMN
jgi:LEA14-like dessication related protein